MKHDNSYSYKPQYDPFENVMTRNGLHEIGRAHV